MSAVTVGRIPRDTWVSDLIAVGRSDAGWRSSGWRRRRGGPRFGREGPLRVSRHYGTGTSVSTPPALDRTSRSSGPAPFRQVSSSSSWSPRSSTRRRTGPVAPLTRNVTPAALAASRAPRGHETGGIDEREAAGIDDDRSRVRSQCFAGVRPEHGGAAQVQFTLEDDGRLGTLGSGLVQRRDVEGLRPVGYSAPLAAAPSSRHGGQGQTGRIRQAARPGS